MSSPDRYSRVAIVLHWAIAAMIIFNLAFGFFMEGFPQPYRRIFILLHISAGISVLALTVIRVLWRITHEPPPHSAGMKAWERHLAHFVHLMLYVLMVVMPLTGWALISANPPPGSAGAIVAERERALRAPPPVAGQQPVRRSTTVHIWGLIPLPRIDALEKIGSTPGGVGPQKELHDRFVEWHEVGAFIMIFLLLLHVAGALKHQYIDKEAEMARMGLGRRRRKKEPAVGAGAAL